MDIIWTNLLRAILIDIVIYFTIHLLIFHINEKISIFAKEMQKIQLI